MTKMLSQIKKKKKEKTSLPSHALTPKSSIVNKSIETRRKHGLALRYQVCHTQHVPLYTRHHHHRGTIPVLLMDSTRPRHAPP